ncbi:hypothetical protein [Endozoicomonas sp. ALC020]|uniref:hypothetical protein n=1 Tax=unclassified Endozoicomonas TaxID=2644528 RepID=UPI003BAE2D17
MKKTLSSSLLLLLAWLAVTCHAESLKTHFIVEFEHDGGVSEGSFFIQRDLDALSYNPSSVADISDDAGLILPPDDNSHRVGGYGATKSLIESISWELIYVSHLLVAYKLILTTGDTPLSAKSYSWMLAEAFATLGLLLKSYWNPDSPLFNPMDQLDPVSMLAQGDHPVLITTKTKPQNGEGQNGQQNQPQNQPSQSQASGTTPHLTTALSSLMSSGSGGGNQGPEQPRHTLSFNCYVDSCNGFCRLRQFGSSESVAGARSSERSSTGHTNRDMTGAPTYQLGVGSSILIVIPSIAFRDRQNSVAIGHLAAGFDPSTTSEPWVRTVMSRSEVGRFPFDRFRPYGVMVSDVHGHLRELGNHTMGSNCSFDSCNGFCRLRQSGDSGSAEGSLRSEGSSAGHTNRGMTGMRNNQLGVGGSLLIVIPSIAFRERQNSAAIGHLVAGFDPSTTSEPWVRICIGRSEAARFPLDRFRPYGVMVSDVHGHLRELGNHTMSSNCFFDSCNGFCRLGESGGSTEVSLRSEGSSAGRTQTFQPQAGGSSVSVMPSSASGAGQNWRQNQPSQLQASGASLHSLPGFNLTSCGFGRGSSFLNALLAVSLSISRLPPISGAHNHSTELAGIPEDSSDTHGAGWDVDSDMDVDPYEE